MEKKKDADVAKQPEVKAQEEPVINDEKEPIAETKTPKTGGQPVAFFRSSYLCFCRTSLHTYILIDQVGLHSDHPNISLWVLVHTHDQARTLERPALSNRSSKVHTYIITSMPQYMYASIHIKMHGMQNPINDC